MLLLAAFMLFLSTPPLGRKTCTTLHSMRRLALGLFLPSFLCIGFVRRECAHYIWLSWGGVESGQGESAQSFQHALKSDIIVACCSIYFPNRMATVPCFMRSHVWASITI